MPAINVLTTRDIHIAVKKNDGINYLLNRFSFGTEDLLFQAIRKVSPSNAESFIKDLKKKQKKNIRLSAASELSAGQVCVEAKKDEEVLSIQEEPLEEIQTLVAETVAKNPAMSLENLQQEELELSHMLCSLEVSQ